LAQAKVLATCWRTIPYLQRDDVLHALRYASIAG
jgi:hypothetical protein